MPSSPLNPSHFSTVARSTSKLNDSDLRSIQKYMWDARSKWFNIGIQLSVTIGDLEAIKKENPDCGGCLTRVLLTWLRKGSPTPTWQSLITAMKVPAVGVGVTLEQQGISIVCFTMVFMFSMLHFNCS